MEARKRDKLMRNKLRQAMHWGRLDMAREALESLDHGEASIIDLNENLMWSLIHNSPDFVQLFLDYGAKVSRLMPTDDFMLRLHKSRSEVERNVSMHRLEYLVRHPIPSPNDVGGAFSQERIAFALEELYEEASQEPCCRIGVAWLTMIEICCAVTRHLWRLGLAAVAGWTSLLHWASCSPLAACLHASKLLQGSSLCAVYSSLCALSHGVPSGDFSACRPSTTRSCTFANCATASGALHRATPARTRTPPNCTHAQLRSTWSVCCAHWWIPRTACGGTTPSLI